MEDGKYDVFISYSRKDKEVVFPYVQQISDALKRECWIDLKGIESGMEFEEVIIKAIDECKVVLFMLSDNSLRTRWTKREVIYAEDEGKRIVPILVDGDRLRGWFKFHFGNVDYINIYSEEQKEKLISNLRVWLGVEDEEAKLRAEEEKRRKQAEERKKLEEERKRWAEQRSKAEEEIQGGEKGKNKHKAIEESENFHSLSANLLPFTIRNIEIHASLRDSVGCTRVWPRIYYSALKSGFFVVDVKIFGWGEGGDPSTHFWSNALSLSIGEGFKDLNGPEAYGHWTSGSYRIQIWYQGTLMAEQVFQLFLRKSC